MKAIPVVGYKGDASRFRSPCQRFTCRERIVDDGDGLAVVAFECSLRGDAPLSFHCREPSCGVLTREEPAAVKVDDGTVDPSFFDAGYTLAGKTGFQVWPGSRLVVEGLIVPQEDDSTSLREWQDKVAEGVRILELGSGVGVVGAVLAQGGAQVLLTDLPTLVADSLEPNLRRNAEPKSGQAVGPTWMTADASSEPIAIGRGWVSAAALDWTIPVDRQLSAEQCQVDLIIASDCVWLATMLEGLLDSVQAIWNVASHRSPKLLMSFQRRDPQDGTESKMFTTVDRVLTEIQKRQWKVECLAWHPVVYNLDGAMDDSKEVFLFLVEPFSN